MTYFLWNTQTNYYLSKESIGWKHIQYFDSESESNKGWTDYKEVTRALTNNRHMRTVIIVNNRELLRKYLNLVMGS